MSGWVREEGTNQRKTLITTKIWRHPLSFREDTFEAEWKSRNFEPKFIVYEEKGGERVTVVFSDALALKLREQNFQFNLLLY